MLERNRLVLNWVYQHDMLPIKRCFNRSHPVLHFADTISFLSLHTVTMTLTVLKKLVPYIFQIPNITMSRVVFHVVSNSSV